MERTPWAEGAARREADEILVQRGSGRFSKEATELELLCCPHPQPGLAAINHRAGVFLSPLSDTSVRRTLLSDRTKCEPRAPRPNNKEEAKTDPSRARSWGSPCPGTTKFGLTFLVLSCEVTANQSGQHKRRSTWPRGQTPLGP